MAWLACSLRQPLAFVTHFNMSLYVPAPKNEAPAIALPLSTYWWDDRAWNLEIEAESR